MGRNCSYLYDVQLTQLPTGRQLNVNHCSNVIALLQGLVRGLGFPSGTWRNHSAPMFVVGQFALLLVVGLIESMPRPSTSESVCPSACTIRRSSPSRKSFPSSRQTKLLLGLSEDLSLLSLEGDHERHHGATTLIRALSQKPPKSLLSAANGDHKNVQPALTEPNVWCNNNGQRGSQATDPSSLASVL